MGPNWVCLWNMPDAVMEVRAKMRAEGLSAAAIRAFLHQFDKLIRNESGFIPEETILPVSELPALEERQVPENAEALAGQTVVLKLNGGLGTSMGLEKAKTLLRIRDDLTFLDIIVRQALSMGAKRVDTLFFMNSFSTSADTLKALSKYPELGDPRKMELMQSKVPKIDAETLQPIEWLSNRSLEWCPPGHGDIYPSLVDTGLLDRLIKEGKKYLFVSNADNLGATLDLRLLGFFEESDAPFLMEVTRRTGSDRKGGHLAKRKSDGRLLLRESAQCPEADDDSFQDIGRHRFFNTNSLWIRLEPLREELARGNGLLPLPLIRNLKTVDPRDKKSPKVYQLETAMGAAIECFAGASAVEVPRSRFAPVKATTDLLAVRSDVYTLDPEYRLRLDADRHGVPPVVKLDDRYKLVDAFEELVSRGVPSLARCKSLTVEGSFVFEPGVQVMGEVKFINPGSETQIIRAGTYKDQIHVADHQG